MASVATWESRVGIARDPTTRTAKEHALFAARHVRPHDDLELLVGIAGVPNAWTQPLDQAVIPFGGEGRQARIRNASAPALPRMPEGDWPDPQQYTVTFLTPAFLPAEAWVPGAQVAGLPGKVVAACCAEPIRIGGWDSEARQPLPARSAVPAGSTWFFEQAAEHVDRKRLAALHGSQLANAEGDDSWGFGFMAIGRWATTHERMTP
jgi:CRISPR-associated protein Cmr3